jgi:hypothetical protein
MADAVDTFWRWANKPLNDNHDRDRRHCDRARFLRRPKLPPRAPRPSTASALPCRLRSIRISLRCVHIRIRRLLLLLRLVRARHTNQTRLETRTPRELDCRLPGLANSLVRFRTHRLTPPSTLKTDASTAISESLSMASRQCPRKKF